MLNSTSPFLPTSRTFQDVSAIDHPELFSRILNKFSEDVSSNINARTIGVYTQNSSPIGNTFFGVDILRVVAAFSTLLNGANPFTTDISPSGNLVVTSLYGIAQDVSTAITLPYINVATLSDSISVTLSGNTVIVTTTTSNWTSFSGFICIEYGYK